MPKGKGTYGSQVGRPSKKQSNKYMGGGMTDQFTPIPVNDAMNRNTNMSMDEYMGGGKTQINPMGYREGGEVEMPMYKEGGKTQNLTEEDIQFMKDAIANKKNILSSQGLKVAKKAMKEMNKKSSDKKVAKPKAKAKPKYGKAAKSQQEKDIKRYTAGKGKATVKSKGAQYSTKGTSEVVKEGKKYKRKLKMKLGGKTRKPVNAAKNPGLAKLPEDVRNKMGYMQRGGKAEKDDEATAKSMRKTSIYMAGPKEKGPAGGVVKGVRRNKRTIGKKKRETMKSKAAKMNLKEIKESRSKRVRTVKKYETGQGPTYKGGKGFKPRKRKKYAMGGRAAGNRVMTENAMGQIEGKVYKK